MLNGYVVVAPVWVKQGNVIIMYRAVTIQLVIGCHCLTTKRILKEHHQEIMPLFHKSIKKKLLIYDTELQRKEYYGEEQIRKCCALFHEVSLHLRIHRK